MVVLFSFLGRSFAHYGTSCYLQTKTKPVAHVCGFFVSNVSKTSRIAADWGAAAAVRRPNEAASCRRALEILHPQHNLRQTGHIPLHLTRQPPASSSLLLISGPAETRDFWPYMSLEMRAFPLRDRIKHSPQVKRAGWLRQPSRCLGQLGWRREHQASSSLKGQESVCVCVMGVQLQRN